MPGSGIDKIQKDLKDGYEYDEMIEGSAGVLKDTIFPKKPKEKKMSASLLDNIRKINTGAGSQYDENVMLTYKSGQGFDAKLGGKSVRKTVSNIKTGVDAVKNIKKEGGLVSGIKKTINDKKTITKTKPSVATNVGDAIKNFKTTISSSYEMIDEKAVSQQQQKFMGMVYAYKKGEMPNASDEVKKAAEGMTMKEVEKYASTKHAKLPKKIEEKLNKDDEPILKKLHKMLLKSSDSHKKQAKLLSKSIKEQLGGVGPKVAPSSQEMKKKLTVKKETPPTKNLEYGTIAQRQKVQSDIEDMGNQRVQTTTTSGTGAGGLKDMSISDGGTVKSFNANAISKLGKMSGAKLEMDSGGLVPNVGKYVQDVGKNILAKNSLVPDATKGKLNKGLATTAQNINQQTPGADAFKQKTIAMQINKNVRKNQNLKASYNMDENIADEALTIQDWNVDDIKFTEIETIDIIKTKPLKENMSNWRGELETELDEDWQKVNRKDKTDGLSQKAVNAYRKENPGSKLKTAVTKDPKKLKKGSKSAKRRLSFCRRMKGMKKKLTSAKTSRDPNSRINKALRRWNC